MSNHKDSAGCTKFSVPRFIAGGEKTWSLYSTSIQTRVLCISICTLMQNRHEFCKLLIRTILYQLIQTLIKHVFLFNYRHELIMSLIIVCTLLVKLLKVVVNFSGIFEGSLKQ